VGGKTLHVASDKGRIQTEVKSPPPWAKSDA